MKSLTAAEEHQLIQTASAVVDGMTLVDIERTARRLGVVEITPRIMKIDGYLGRNPKGQYVIRYRTGSCVPRKRFTIAHELGHMLLADFLGEQLTVPVARSERRDSDEERWANRLAAELLIPARALSSVMQHRAVSWKTLYAVAGLFQVSVVALIRRLREVESIFSVEMQRVGETEKLSIAYSRHARPLFHQPPETEFIRIQRSRYRKHILTLDVRGIETRLECVSRSSGELHGQQVVGWQHMKS